MGERRHYNAAGMTDVMQYRVGAKKAERLYEQGFRSIEEAMKGAKMEKAQHLIVEHLDVGHYSLNFPYPC